MSDIVLDCKGMPCPQPVLQCKQCIDNDDPAELSVIVDNEAARENVTRFLESKGYQAVCIGGDAQWRIVASGRTGTGSKAVDGQACDCEVMSPAEIQALEQKVTVFIPADVVGKGDDELGGKLLVNFIATLPELGHELWRIVLVNAGVKLSIPGHPCFNGLKTLEDAGATILVCGTCLDHFGLLNDRGLGQTTNMLDVVTSMQLATKVIHV
ncbi:sulfurtransferase-like selenium metabolism protein YedF [Desulfovibrio ferrophilus]|uniref:Selenium metabolism protein YedF n=1 Tax=Desulfovibrio ferrophilus TaxID=241368 RepID=A0A2Z6AWR9_9BACT|nr:sulfurtransferase-like selenium metabolism protein YedF [Desulfovibrio ferrophilus]BBD07694.1 selenium metabolism protein YedF [Desulfovibrio ferrophilus]